jgi:hypothetical protein
LNASIQAARPLLEQLEFWRSSQAQYEVDAGDVYMGKQGASYASVHFAYHLLVIYIYRALYRPMVQSTAAPHVVDLEEPIVVDDLLLNDDFSWDLPALANATPFPTLNDVESDVERPQMEVVEDIVKAASESAAGMINLVRRFSLADVSNFWHSCRNLPLLCIPLAKQRSC